MNITSRRWVGLLGTLGLSALASVAAAQASVVWTWTGVQVLEPTMVSSSPPDVPVVACDPAGHAVTVWNSPSQGVVFSERCPAGTWSPSTTVIGGALGSFAQVAIGPSGVVAVAWLEPKQQYVPPKIAVTVRAPGGAFGAPNIWTTSVNVFDMRLGVALDGSVTFVWNEGGRMKSALRSPAGVWSAPTILSPANVVAWLPDLATNSAGAALAVWQETPVGGSGPASIGTAYRSAPAGSAWDAPQSLGSSAGLATWNPKPGIDAAGDVAVGFLDGNTMVLATKPLGGNWTTTTPVSPPNDSVYYPALAMDAAGNIITAWQKLNASNYGRISKRVIPATGPWGTVTALSPAGHDASWPVASIANNGSMWAVTWGDNNTFAAQVAIGDLSGASVLHTIGSVWWNTSVPIAAGNAAISAVWPAHTNNPNVTNMVANVYTGANKSYCTAGTTSHGCVPSISGVGDPSATAGSGYTIMVSNVEGQQNGLIFYGIHGGQATPWSSNSTSFLCVKPPTQRMTTLNSGGTSGACDGALSLDWNAYIATHTDALGCPFVGGELVWAQGWFRDLPSAKSTGLSDALMFAVCP